MKAERNSLERYLGILSPVKAQIAEEMALDLYQAIHRLFIVLPEPLRVLTAKQRDLDPQAHLEFEAEGEGA